MSANVYPVLPGMDMALSKTPEFLTVIQEAMTGREVRIAERLYPMYNVTLKYNFLRDTSVLPELKTLGGFYMARSGPFDSFLLTDPDDNAVVNQSIGTGNGVTTAFQLTRSFGGFAEPCFNINGQPQVSISGLPVNLIQNGQFELRTGGDQPYGFTTYSTTTSVYTSPAANHGSYAYGVKATGSNAGSCVLGFAAGIGTNPGAGVTGGAVPYTGWVPFATYTIQFVAKKVNGAAFVGMALEWNQPPASTTIVANPTLSTGYQTYTFQITWGAVVEGSGRLYVSIDPTAVATNDEIDIDDLVVSAGTVAGNSVTPGSYSLSNGVVTFDAAPAAAAPIAWTGNYYFNARFADDKLQLDRFMNQLWSAGTVNLRANLQDRI